jgi:hypothetical protein
MDPSTEAALRILDEIKREPVPTSSLALSEAYLRAVERLERRAEFQAGVDKSWVVAASRRHRKMLARATRVR